jgi:hypothetical protein
MITDNPRRIVFCGHHDAGKDEAAKFLCAAYHGLEYGGSISHYLAEYVASRLGIDVGILRGPNRHDYAMEFFRLGEEARNDDPGRFLRKALAAGNVVTGIRDPREITWGRTNGEVGLFVWVDRPVPVDPTMQRYGADLCDVTIMNHGTLAGFHRTLKRWADFSGFRRLDRRPSGD